MLPIAGVRGGEEVTTANTSTAWTQIRRINVQHRVNGVRVTGYHRCGSGWHHIGAVVYDGTAVNGAEWSATQYGYTSVVDRYSASRLAKPSERSTRCNCKSSSPSAA